MPIQQPDDERLVALHDGAQVWTVTSGAGSPVVLCHGGPGLWDYLGDLAGLLESKHTVVRFEQRGCGRSSAHPTSPALARQRHRPGRSPSATAAGTTPCSRSSTA